MHKLMMHVQNMLPIFHIILSSILFLIPVFIFFYDLFSFYFFEKNKKNQLLTSESLKIFKDKYIEVMVPSARKNLEAQAITGHKNITSDLIEYLLDKNIKNLNFTLYICSKAIHYIDIKRLDPKDDSSNLVFLTKPPMYFDQIKIVLKLAFILFVLYFWASEWLINVFMTIDAPFKLKYFVLTLGSMLISYLAIKTHEYRCLLKLQSIVEDLD